MAGLTRGLAWPGPLAPLPRCSTIAGRRRPGSAVLHHLPPTHVPSVDHAAWLAWPQWRQASVCLRAAAKLGEQNQRSISPGLRLSGSGLSCHSVCPGLRQSPGWTTGAFLPPAPKQPTAGLEGQMVLLLPGGSGEGRGLGSSTPPGPLPCAPVHAARLRGPLRSSRPHHRPLVPRVEKHGNGSMWKPALLFSCFWTDV